MAIPYPDPSNPALPSPLFSDITAVRGDHLRANNNAIFADLNYLESEIAANWVRTIYGDNAYGSTLVTDFNAITKSGFYTGYGAATGAPNTDYSWFVMHQNSAVGTASEYQRAVAFSTEFVVYERTKISSTWGAWRQIGDVLSDILTKSVPTSTATLAKTDLSYGMVIFTGATVDVTVTWPVAYTKKCQFKNSTSYNIMVKTPSGTGITLYPGDIWVLYCDGTNVLPISWNQNHVVGFERLTAERYAGYPVYEKIVTCGALPNTTFKDVPHGISGAFTCVPASGISGMATDGSFQIPLPDARSNDLTALTIDATNIRLTTITNRSSYTRSWVMIKYVKVAL